MMENKTFIIHDEEDDLNDFMIYRDERHGKKGFRVLQFARKADIDDFHWTENYLFYENLNDFYDELEKEDFTKGKAAF